MTIEELKQQATAITGGFRGWQSERIVALCLEFAAPLAKAVETGRCTVPASDQAREVLAALAPEADAPLDLTLTNGWKCCIRSVSDGTKLCFAEPGDNTQVYLRQDGLWHESLGRDNYGWPDATTILDVLRRGGCVAEVLAALKETSGDD